MIDVEELRRLTPTAADAWIGPINRAMADRSITSPPRVAMFLATILYESAGLTRLEENLNYSAESLIRVWPSRFTWASAQAYEHHPELIANRVYANRLGNGDEASGDGWRYRGRGGIQSTGRGNYAEAGEANDLPLIEEPGMLLDVEPAAAVAAWFWWRRGCNELADDSDFTATQGMVNRGSATKPADNMRGRLEWLNRVRAVLI